MAELRRYSGLSLEEVMGKVNDALGPDAEILEARRVRRGGVLGVLKRDVVEIVARPRPMQAPVVAVGTRLERLSPVERVPAGADRTPVDHAAQPAPYSPRAVSGNVHREDFAEQLRSLIDEVDLREERQLSQRPAAPAMAVVGSGRRFTEDDFVPLSEEPAPIRAARVPVSAASAGTATRVVSPARREAGSVQGSRVATRTTAPGEPRPALPSRRVAPRRAGLLYAPAAGDLGDTPVLLPDPVVAFAAAVDLGDAPVSLPDPVEASVDHAPVRVAPPTAGAQAVDLRERRCGPSWSERALRDLGLPDVVLDLMPMAVLRSDLDWTVALEAAIRASVPAPTVPVSMCGYGAQSAVKVLESMLDGCAMGEMMFQDRSVMATSFELALAVRQCLSQ